MNESELDPPPPGGDDDGREDATYDASAPGATPPPGAVIEDGVLQDGTLGGYLDAHERPPSFEGADGHPYTVSVEVERTADLERPWVSYLVFPRWAINGMGIVGHVQSPLLGRERRREEAEELARSLGLVEVERLLNEAVARAEARGEAG